MLKDPLVEIGAMIRQTRERQQLGVQDLALRSKVSIKHIQNIENGERAELPEGVYLIGFLTKILKSLNITNAPSIIEKYRKLEGDFVLQDVINSHNPKQEKLAKSHSGPVFQLYHLYILIVILLIAIGVYALRSMIPHEPAPKPVLEEPSKPIKKIEPIIETITKGEGSIKLLLKIQERTWFQVFGQGSKKILFEGTIEKPTLFELYDEIGFALSTGNAGGTFIDQGQGFQRIGTNGQQMKFYFPESLRPKVVAPIVKPAPVRVKPIVKRVAPKPIKKIVPVAPVVNQDQSETAEQHERKNRKSWLKRLTTDD
ncbi:MAG: helix-turn-helix domain-containing protein [Candidatus Caenarcaniphilales bacterium]|jgi:transcriptional regulator with XRE-family HTH domain|nr:helix-turn-helix domain-containing protein [Candidatus Caenarcaniphilales bacterium]